MYTHRWTINKLQSSRKEERTQRASLSSLYLKSFLPIMLKVIKEDQKGKANLTTLLVASQIEVNRDAYIARLIL